ncbi:unnamed protein product, partial [Prorocentrum cordatum]
EKKSLVPYLGFLGATPQLYLRAPIATIQCFPLCTTPCSARAAAAASPSSSPARLPSPPGAAAPWRGRRRLPGPTAGQPACSPRAWTRLTSPGKRWRRQCGKFSSCTKSGGGSWRPRTPRRAGASRRPAGGAAGRAAAAGLRPAGGGREHCHRGGEQ